MNLPDSFYIALCMTILLVGAVYWVWTQIQYVQRKVNVLENIVYELKTMCSRPPETGPVGPISPTLYPSIPEEDLHETLSREIAPEPVQDVQEPFFVPTQDVPMEPQDMPMEIQDMPLDVQDIPMETQDMQPDVQEAPQEVHEVPDFAEEPVELDLQPGGVGSGVVVPSLQSSLDGMTIKELRRLAAQKGITNANDLKKKELIQAIRAMPIESFLE